jgi:hypothetical protein
MRPGCCVSMSFVLYGICAGILPQVLLLLLLCILARTAHGCCHRCRRNTACVGVRDGLLRQREDGCTTKKTIVSANGLAKVPRMASQCSTIPTIGIVQCSHRSRASLLLTLFTQYMVIVNIRRRNLTRTMSHRRLTKSNFSACKRPPQQHRHSYLILTIPGRSPAHYNFPNQS